MSTYRHFPFFINMTLCKEIAFNAEATYGDAFNTVWYRYPDGLYGNKVFLDINEPDKQQ